MKKKAHTPNYRHIAAIVKRGEPIAIAANRIGTRSRGSGWSDCTIHAERAVVKKLGDISKLRGATLYVLRIPPDITGSGKPHAVKPEPELCESKPCADCTHFLEKCMKEYGLERVYYTSAPPRVEKSTVHAPAKPRAAVSPRSTVSPGSKRPGTPTKR